MPNSMLAAGRSLLPLRSCFSLLLALSVILFAGCGGEDAPPTAPPATGKISVTPIEPTVLVGDTLRFTATLQDIAPGVTWSLSAATATTDSLGTITQDGLYKAPVRVTSFYASKVKVRATSTADANVFGETVCTVPRITLTITPSSYESVLPGSILPFNVTVANSHDPSYRAFVDGVENGNSIVGTWTTTSNTTGIYMTAAREDMVINHQIFAKSVEDETRFSLPSNVRVRGGRALSADAGQNQVAPEWSPVSDSLAYVQGPPWQLMVYGALPGHASVTDVMWTGAVYDGRLSWSRDGSRIAFSEEVGGRRVIGIVDLSGANRQTFDPDPALEYLEAAFLPTDLADPESLIVSVRGAGTSALRAYLASSTEMGSGRLVYTPPGGREVRWPDAARFNSQNWIAAVNQGAATSDVISFKDDGEDTPNFVATGVGLRSHVGWSIQGVGFYWINYIWDANQNYYRVNHTGSIPAARMYTDLFPEHSGDVSIVTADEHAVSRLEESGLHHIWIVEYPPREFTGVPKAQELEMESIGIRGAIQPNSWRRWLGDNSWSERPRSR
jgi:hypothetical protein